MNLDYCNEFIELARRLNFTETAHELNITQSTLSKHMSALEKELGAKLLERHHEGARLTEEGYAFFGSAVNIVDILETTKQAIALMASNDAIVVDGQLQDPTVSGLVSTAIMMNNENQRTPIKFNRSHVKAPLDQLDSGDVDILIMGETASRLQERDLAFRQLTETPFVAIMESTHPLAKRDALHLADLRNETLVQFLDEYSRPGWRTIEEACINHGFTPKCRPILVQSVTEQLATPLHGCVIIFPKTSKELRYVTGTAQRVTIPIVDDDACFSSWCIFRKEDEERLTPFLNALEAARQER